MFKGYFAMSMEFGHQAFRELSQVYEHYKNKTPHDYAKLMAAELVQGSRNILEAYILATLSFQFMMDAIIHQLVVAGLFSDALGENKPTLVDDFKMLWGKALRAKGISTQQFDKFFQIFYNDMYLEIICPRDLERFHLSGFRFKKLYESFKLGLDVFRALSEKMGGEVEGLSWETLCEKNGLPEVLNLSALQNIDGLLEYNEYHHNELVLNFVCLGERALSVLAKIQCDYERASDLLSNAPAETFFILGLCSSMSQSEKFNAMLTIVVFHAMVEAIVNVLCKQFSIDDVHLSDKLTALSGKLGLEVARKSYVTFYEKYHYGFLHPVMESECQKFFSEYYLKTVYDGLNAGWRMAYDLLGAARGQSATEMSLVPSLPDWETARDKQQLPDIGKIPLPSFESYAHTMAEYFNGASVAVVPEAIPVGTGAAQVPSLAIALANSDFPPAAHETGQACAPSPATRDTPHI